MALEITIISAKHLKNVNWRNGDLTPYVAVSLDASKTRLFSTKPDPSGSTRPVWNEPFRFPVPNSSRFLSLDVFHSGQPDILVGSAKFPIYGSENRTLELRRPSGRPHGKIRVRIICLTASLPPVSVPGHRFAPSVSDCYRFTPPGSDCCSSTPRPAVSGLLSPPRVSFNYGSAPPVSSCYDSTPPVSDCHNPTHLTVSGLRSPQEQDRHFTPGVSFNYGSTPPVSNCYDFNHSVSDCYDFNPPVSDCYNPTHLTVSGLRSPQVQDGHFAPNVSCNYGSTPLVSNCYDFNRPVSDCYNPTHLTVSGLQSPQVQNGHFAPDVSCNYGSTPLVSNCYDFNPPVSSCYSFAHPTVSCSLPPSASFNYDSATVTPQQDYDFSPSIPYNYDSVTAPLAPSPPPPPRSSGQAQDYIFSPSASGSYDSATATGSLLARQSSGQAQDYNISPPVSSNYDSATAPPVPSPLPPQQSGSLPAQLSSGQSQDYNFTPPPHPESTIPPPPQRSSTQARDNTFTPPSLRNYDTAPPPAYPLPIRPQQSLGPDLRQGSYGGEQPSAPVDYNAQYNGDNVERGCFGDEVALARAMRGMALVESDLGSKSDDSKSSRSYKAQPSAPVIRGSDDYGMF